MANINRYDPFSNVFDDFLKGFLVRPVSSAAYDQADGLNQARRARIDVTVASLGDAKSLQGGVLLQTPLLGADGRAYAVAQGAIVIGGFLGGAGGAGGATVQKNHPTVGSISNGAIVEREIASQIVHDNSLRLLLHNPDFTSAARMYLSFNHPTIAA